MTRRITVALSLVVALGLTSPAARSGDDKPAAPKADLSPPAKAQLHLLKNDELLKQAKGLYDKAAEDYLAAARGLAAAEAQLGEAARPAEVRLPGKAAEDEPPGAEGVAKAAVDAARTKADSARKQLHRAQERKKVLDLVLAAGEAVQRAALAFLNALEDLKPYAVEITLRVKDGTLPADRAPAELLPDALEKRRKKVADDQAQRKGQAAATQAQQAAVAKELEAADKAVLAADAEVNQAGKALAQEQKRQEMEKAYAGQKPDALLRTLARLVEEGDGLKGTYELSLARFHSHAGQADKLRKALGSLEAPDAVVPQITRAEDVEVAAKAIQGLIAFHSARVKATRDLLAATQGLVERGSEFEADAAVSSGHLFRMNVVAGLLTKAGLADDKFPDGGQPNRVAGAAERQAKSAAEVQAALGKARAEILALGKLLADAEQAAESAAKQLHGLKQSQEATKAALKWEGQLRAKTVAQVSDLFGATRAELAGALEGVKKAGEAYRKAAAALAEARGRLDALKDPFLRQAEEQGQGERLKIAAELSKLAGLDRSEKKDASAPPPTAAQPKKADGKGEKKEDPTRKPEPPRRSEIEKAADSLAAFQEVLAARSRVLEERDQETKKVLAALDDLVKKATEYSTALSKARQLALQLTAAGSELKKRVGKGQLGADRLPEGVTEALRGNLLAQLDADASGALAALSQADQDRESLRRPDPTTDALKAAARELLAAVDARLDKLTDLRKLAADYQRDAKDRSPSEAARLEQQAADRRADATSTVEALLGIDNSTGAKKLEELLTACYRELVEIEEKGENLQQQKEKLEALVGLTGKESEAAAKLLPLIEAESERLLAAQEEEFVLARARLMPGRADELLRAYQTKTGRVLARPLPVQEGERAEKVSELAGGLFARLARRDAVRRWGEVVAARLGPGGVRAEAGVYQDELARQNATASANARRIVALAGDEKDGTGGEIGKARKDLLRVRAAGVKVIALKLATIVLGALVVPWLFARAVRRLWGEDMGLVLSAAVAVVKAGVWVGALALALSVLGFDVTAILAGLGIGGLAVGLAAQSMISDVIAAVVIFAERKFKVGDVVRIGGNEPARVVGLNWRSTQLRTPEGLVVNVPNQKVIQRNLQSLTRDGRTYDGLTVTVTTERDSGAVLAVIREALAGEELAADGGVAIQKFRRKGDAKVIQYKLWWFLKDYEARSRTRDRVFAQVSEALSGEALKDTEVTLS